jgi:hypothetical protein
MIPSPVYRTDPGKKKWGISRTSLLIVQQRWVVSELITLAPKLDRTKTVSEQAACMDGVHAGSKMGGAIRAQKKKERKALISTVVVVPGMPGQRKNTDFGGGGGALGGAQTKKKRHCSLR